jgi:hypothetical protein
LTHSILIFALSIIQFIIQVDFFLKAIALYQLFVNFNLLGFPRSLRVGSWSERLLPPFFLFPLHLKYFIHRALSELTQVIWRLRIIFIFLVELLFFLNYPTVLNYSCSYLFWDFAFHFLLSIFFPLLLDIIFWNQKIIVF